MARHIGKPSAIKRRKTITVTGLYLQFEKACAALEALPRGTADDHPKLWSRAIDKCITLAKLIVRTRHRAFPRGPGSMLSTLLRVPFGGLRLFANFAAT